MFLAIVHVEEVANVAAEGAVAENGLKAVALRCVTIGSRTPFRCTVSFDGVFDAVMYDRNGTSLEHQNAGRSARLLRRYEPLEIRLKVKSK